MSGVGKKLYKCLRDNPFASVCHAANKMYFVKHESSSTYVNESMMQREYNVEYNQSLHHITPNRTRDVRPYMCAMTLNNVPTMTETVLGNLNKFSKVVESCS